MEDGEGRWFVFSPQMTDFIILEKAGLPEHLTVIENLDRAVTLQSILADLADHGEASRHSKHSSLTS